MVDFKALHRIFADEAMERISELEIGLLELEKSPHDDELLNTIFRAAHTIKGSSGTIGLKDIAQFTHHMEEILDLVRQKKVVPDKRIITLLLDATDLIKEMVEAVASETSFDFTRAAAFVPRLEELKQVKAERMFKIMIIPNPDLFRRGIDPSVFIEDLSSIGEIVTIKADTTAVPAFSEFNPEDLYLRWDIVIKTAKGVDEIRTIFEFIEEGSEIKIFPVNPVSNEVPPLGQMLIEEGAAKAEDIEEALKTQKQLQRRLGDILVEQGKVNPGELERVLEKQKLKKIDSFKNSVSSTIRVDLKKLDLLINLVGEMVIIHSMFQQALTSTPTSSYSPEIPLTGHQESERISSLFSQLQRIGKELQESAMSLRMLPVGEIFQRFTRLVRELSESKGKNINLIITGEDTELDKGVLEKITDPLVHLIRNAVDHGIETKEERIAAGKPECGTINLSAYQMGDSVYIEVEDDGKGLNKERIIEKAVAQGIIPGAAGLSDDQIHNLIFMPGLSTAERITDVSGRGVGMDVVKKNIESLSGRIYIKTRPGEGTLMTIKLPLTLAIVDGLTVLVGDEVFIIPISSVIESLRPDRKDVETLNERGEVIHVRGEYIPLLRLHEILNLPCWRKNPWEALVVITAYEGKKYALLVDELIGQQQVVIKSLGKALPKVSDVAGGTILGNGKVALVLDIPGIIEFSKHERSVAERRIWS